MNKPIRATTIVCLLAIMLTLTCWPDFSLADESFQWTEPANVSQSLSESEGPVIVSGSDGKTHIVWEEEGVLVRSCLDGETWTDPLPFFVGEFPAACVEGSTLHLVWVDEIEGVQEILYSSWGAGVWTPPVNVSYTDGDCTSPAMGVTSGGRLHVAWGDDTPGYPCIYRAYSDNGALWAVGPIPNAAGQAPCIAVDSHDVVHVAWHDRFLPEEPNHIYHSQWDGEEWSWATDVSDSLNDATFPQALVDLAGSVHLVWGEVVGEISIVRHSLLRAGDYWTLPTDVSSAGVDAWAPRLVLDGDGQVAAAWNEADKLSFCFRDQASGDWLTPDVIVEDATGVNEVAIAAGTGGGLQAAWSGPGGAGREIYYSRGTVGTAPETLLMLPLVFRGL
ncbi:MAG: hypothetical protein ABIK79_06935 [Chloroflexota bacterium]